MEKTYILAINPGSTSTKISLFEDENLVKSHKFKHKIEELKSLGDLVNQYPYRERLILDWLKQENISMERIKAVVGRGGLVRPVPGGTYQVTEAMVNDLKIAYQGEHAANLGGIIAYNIAKLQKIPAYIVDPVALDELSEIARISGMPDIERKSSGHVLNIKAVSYKYSKDYYKDLEDVNLIVAHMGGGISVAAVQRKKIVDINNANEMGPFSPDRTGELPVGDLVNMCYSGKYTFDEMQNKVKGSGGLVAYLGTNDALEVESLVLEGDKNATLIYEAMSYQIAKEIGKMAAVLSGNVDAIILTGGLAYSDYLNDYVKKMVGFIAPIVIYRGEDEMDALNRGALRILKKQERIKVYEKEVEIGD